MSHDLLGGINSGWTREECKPPIQETRYKQAIDCAYVNRFFLLFEFTISTNEHQQLLPTVRNYYYAIPFAFLDFFLSIT